MKLSKLRILLFPLSVIYYGVVTCRNLLFDRGIMKSSEFDVPTINVGNLTVGGTGKTPHVEYLIRLLKDEFNTATLSRGYGRKTPGFIHADESVTARDIGDEPYQIYRKFKNDIDVFVEVKRLMGIINIMKEKPSTSVILLDDAYQHRAINPGFNILLTDFNKPYFNDFILPVGDLREPISGRERADIIIVTKCPDSLAVDEIKAFKDKLKVTTSQNVFFTKINYGKLKSFNKQLQLIELEDLKHKEVLLVTGIANPKPLEAELEKQRVSFKHLKYPDHHDFTSKNISNIIDIFEEIEKKDKLIVTTEKDAVRLKNVEELEHLPVYYLEIEIKFLENKQLFDNQILNYVKQNQRNS